MIQVLLSAAEEKPLTIWAADGTRLGDRVQWNGTAWSVSAIYGTRFSMALEVSRKERSRKELS